MKKIEICITHKCTTCYPEKITKESYDTGWSQQKIIIGRQKVNENIRCDNCGELLGGVYIK